MPGHEPKPWGGGSPRRRLRRSGSREQKLRRWVLARDEYRCHVCGDYYPEAQLVNDHVVPRGEGGKDDITNMKACCITCHDIKTQEEAKRGRT